MGYGDELIGSGMARGAAARGKRIAFGDGRRIMWSQQAQEIYRGNPNVAAPGAEGADDLEWIKYYKGHRLYGYVEGARWRFNAEFRCKPGEVFFDEFERAVSENLAAQMPKYAVIEPTVKPWGACDGRNKQWPVERYGELAVCLGRLGCVPVQLLPGGRTPAVEQARTLFTNTFRKAMLVLSRASLYVGPEGGLHHAAAALGIPAVVIFGGFNSPQATGYPWHANLTDGGEPCGSISQCPHCAQALASISVERVLASALDQLGQNEQRRVS